MSIRVLRLIEYVYADAERMVDDMARWQHGTQQYGPKLTVRSTSLPPEILEDEPEPDPIRPAEPRRSWPDDIVRKQCGDTSPHRPHRWVYSAGCNPDYDVQCEGIR